MKHGATRDHSRRRQALKSLSLTCRQQVLGVSRQTDIRLRQMPEIKHMQRLTRGHAPVTSATFDWRSTPGINYPTTPLSRSESARLCETLQWRSSSEARATDLPARLIHAFQGSQGELQVTVLVLEGWRYQDEISGFSTVSRWERHVRHEVEKN